METESHLPITPLIYKDEDSTITQKDFVHDEVVFLQNHLEDFCIEGNYCLGYLEGSNEAVDEFLKGFTSLSCAVFVKTDKHTKERTHKRYSQNAPPVFEHSRGNVPIKFFGHPFCIVGTEIRHCSYGSIKDSRGGIKRNLSNSEGEYISLCKGNPIKVQRTRKVGCPAIIQVRTIQYYLDYALETYAKLTQTGRRNAKQTLIQSWKNDLAKGIDLKIMKRHYVKVPFSCEHWGHPIGETKRRCLQPIVSLSLNEIFNSGEVQELKYSEFSVMASQRIVTLPDVLRAAERIKQFANYTPMMTSQTLDNMAGRKLHFKCELFQKVGAFKFRGAINAVLQLVENSAGINKEDITVVTHSSGNHGQALSLAAKICGVNACIVMPNTAPAIKKAAVRGYGARIIDVEPTEQARVEMAAKVVKETPNSVLIHPFNHPHIIAGQGTMALEMLEQVKCLDTLVVPVGGGGMLSGICVAAKALNPNIRIFAAEPLNADDCAKSFAAGEWTPLPGPPSTVADGLKTSTGDLTWPIIQQNIEDVITVSEEEIVSAMRLVWERMKLLIEPSAAVGVAAVLTDKFKSLPSDSVQNVGIVLCGGNVDLDKLPWIN